MKSMPLFLAHTYFHFSGRNNPDRRVKARSAGLFVAAIPIIARPRLGGARLRPVARHVLVAFTTVEWRAQGRVAAFLRLRPWPVEPGRVVANMLVVATGKLCDPVPGFVQVESDDGLLHLCIGTPCLGLAWGFDTPEVGSGCPLNRRNYRLRLNDWLGNDSQSNERPQLGEPRLL